MSETGSYLYAVTADPPVVPGTPGVRGAPLRVLGAGPYAVVSTVPLTEFGAEALTQHLEDLQWLADTARAHHQVVDAVSATAVTAPVRLCTVYRDDARVTAMLAEQATAFCAVLARVTGHREWGVKVFAPGQSVEDTPEVVVGQANPGTSYLSQLRDRRDRRDQERLEASVRANDIHAAIADIAAAGRRYPPQDRRLSGHSAEMILNAAYLLDAEAETALRQLIERLRADGVDVELTGPWAPYSFAEIDGRD